MLALRRSASLLRFQSYSNAVIARICFSQFNLTDYESLNDASPIQLVEPSIFSKWASSRRFSSSNPFSGRRTLSSQTTTTTGKSSDLDEESDTKGDKTDAACDQSDTKALPSESGDDSDSDSVSDSNSASESDSDFEGEGEGKVDELNLPDNENSSGMLLFNAIMKAPRLKIAEAISKHAEDGHSMERNDITTAMLAFRRRKFFYKALQLSEWVESNKCFDLIDRDYASHVDLIAKVHGHYNAEKYLAKIPEPFQTEVVYRTLLANVATSGNSKKTEAIFNRMRELGLPLSDFTCNQLIMLYAKVDKKKIADVLVMMEEKNIKPSSFTYRILIDTKGRSNDIDGMEQVIETMKAEGMVIDQEVLATIARHYISGGFKQKAEALLKEIEGDDIQNKNRWVARMLLPLYATLGKQEDVERIWKLCKDKPRREESLAAIVAWGKLGRVDKAEEIFEQVHASWSNVNPKYYNALLKIYADQKLLAKGKELIKKMSNESRYMDPFTWDAVVRLYLSAGEVEKADYVLHKMMDKSQKKPLYGTYMALLQKYGDRGDIHNAEKIFENLRKHGYSGRIFMYQSLLDAYVNAKTPAYGFRERMKVDNIFPNSFLARQLGALESFKKSHFSDLLLD